MLISAVLLKAERVRTTIRTNLAFVGIGKMSFVILKTVFPPKKILVFLLYIIPLSLDDVSATERFEDYLPLLLRGVQTRDLEI